MPECPNCGAKEITTAVRQGPGVLHGISQHVVDIGWRCMTCRHEWGFEYFQEPPSEPGR